MTVIVFSTNKVEDVDRKFEDLTKLKDNGWIKEEVVVERRVLPKRKVKEPGVAPAAAAAAAAARPRAARSNMRAFIAATRKNQMAGKSPK